MANKKCLIFTVAITVEVDQDYHPTFLGQITSREENAVNLNERAKLICYQTLNVEEGEK